MQTATTPRQLAQFSPRAFPTWILRTPYIAQHGSFLWIRMDWATNGMQLLVEITWLQPVNSWHLLGQQERKTPLEVSVRRKGMFGGLALDNTYKLAITVLSYSALLLAEKLEKRAHCPQPQALLTLPFARHFLNSLSWMKPANI